ncbi:MAG TPA: hypothetical protein VII94_02900, partial [Candidatus Saccharimonadales bacterium]
IVKRTISYLEEDAKWEKEMASLTPEAQAANLKDKQLHDMSASIAQFYSTQRCGLLHLGWALDTFWTKVTNEFFIPSLVKIYDALVAKGLSEDNKLSVCDADGHMYYIPNKDRKVIVYTTQTRNYLFILEPYKTREYFPDKPPSQMFGEEYETHSLHIRKFWEHYNKEYGYLDEKKFKDIKYLIENADVLEEFADDHAEYPQRYSLDMYKKVNFNIDNHVKKPSFFGDMRDSGYIITVSQMYKRADKTTGTFQELELIATCDIGCMAYELDLKIPVLPGYGDRDE